MSFALITGASKGIGQAIAFELAGRNINVLLTARSEASLQQTSKEIEQTYKVKAYYLAADLSDQSTPQRIYEWCAGNNYNVQYLVNNAGYGMSGFFEQYRLEEHLNLIQLNIVAGTQLCHLFLPNLKEHSRGYILNIASTAAYQAVPMLSVYAATKAYVLSFSRGLMQELKQTNVSVTCVSPGPTDTAWSQRANIGGKALKMAKTFNMTPQKVAIMAVDAMLQRKSEVITGVVNKLGVFMAWLMPKTVAEKSAQNLYK